MFSCVHHGPNASLVHKTFACLQTLSTVLENSFTLDQNLEDVLQITEELMNDCLGKNIFTGLLHTLLACFEKKNVYVLISLELLGFGRVDSYRLENSA